MGMNRTYEAIVLRTYDVGEADRFCILLTKERGKIAARARGVRKLTSRMGGSLLPLQHIILNMHEGKTGFLVTAIERCEQKQIPKNVHNFLSAQQGVELLLQLLEDDHPVPEIFDITKEFLKSCEKASVLPFTIRLLSFLGVLPSPSEGKLALHIKDDEREYLQTCSGEKWLSPPDLSIRGARRLNDLCNRIVDQQTSGILRAKEMVLETV